MRRFESSEDSHVLRTLIGIALAVSVLAAMPKPASLEPFEEGERSGYKDAHGKVVIPARFWIAESFGENAIATVADDKGFAWIDRKGRVVARPWVVDNDSDPFYEGLSRIVEKGKFGFIDTNGKIRIAPRFVYVEPFYRGRAAFCTGCEIVSDGDHSFVKGGKWGYINGKGKVVVHPNSERRWPTVAN
jgi:hypothetical protein